MCYRSYALNLDKLIIEINARTFTIKRHGRLGRTPLIRYVPGLNSVPTAVYPNKSSKSETLYDIW
jgi:hypothetical protein